MLSYEDQVDEWVRNGLRRAGTISDLVPRLPGIYPTTIVDSLRRIGVDIPIGKSERLLRLPGPIPHPVDGDWRFHPESHQLIKDLVQRHGVQALAVLASPSLVQPLHGRIGKIALADANTEWAPYFENITIDVCWGDVSLAAHRWPATFDCAIVDPPWYPYELRRFLAIATAIVKHSGIVLLSWPAEGTRPGIAQERISLIHTARRIGLRYVARKKLAIRYATPFYEARALQAAGLPVLAGWRRADLVTFVRDGLPYTDEIDPVHERWKTAKWGNLDLRARESQCENGPADPRLYSVIDGDVLPTVSQRDTRRKAAVIWTRANRIFGCHRPELLLAVMDGLARKSSIQRSVEETLRREATTQEMQWTHEAERQLRLLEAQEAIEYDALHEAIPARQ